MNQFDYNELLIQQQNCMGITMININHKQQKN